MISKTWDCFNGNLEIDLNTLVNDNKDKNPATKKIFDCLEGKKLIAWKDGSKILIIILKTLFR